MIIKKTGLWALLPLALLASRFAEARVPVENVNQEPLQSVDEKLTSFEFDSSVSRRFHQRRFQPRGSRSRLSTIRTLFHDSSKPTRHSKRGSIGSRRESSSPTWLLEKDVMTGSILVIKNKPPGAVVTFDETKLQELSLDRLDVFGIPSAEVLRVLQKKAMRQDLDDGGAGPSPPTTHRFKTFVFRGMNGIPIIGHRAVVSYGVDGKFHRALVHWPALASTGHLLRTKLSAAEIEARQNPPSRKRERARDL